jgi:hypothetical protein
VIEKTESETIKERHEEDEKEKHGIGFFKAWTIDGVAIYATSYALVKLIFYGMLMWLPYYVRTGLGKSKTD